MPEEITEMQKLQLEIIKNTRHNKMYGADIYEDLVANKHLWEGVILFPHDHPPLELYCLRDLSKNIWNCDTVYIYTTTENVMPLKHLADKWNAFENMVGLKNLSL